MKKKAILKTILDVIKLIAKSVIVVAIPAVIVMLFQLFNLFSSYGTYRHIPYGLLFVLGILIILGTFLVIHLIRAQYRINLEEISKNQEIPIGTKIYFIPTYQYGGRVEKYIITGMEDGAYTVEEIDNVREHPNRLCAFKSEHIGKDIFIIKD